MKTRPVVKQAAAALLAVAAACFLVRAVVRNWRQVRAYPWHVDPLLLAASVVALVGVLAWGVWVWGRVLSRFEHAPVGNGTLQRIWFLSNLARYIPGAVFQFVTAAGLSRSAGLSAAVMLTALLVHTGLSLLSAVVVSAWTLTGPLFPALPPAAAVAIGAGVTLAATLVVHPRFLNGALGIIPRLLKKDVIRWNGTWVDGLGLLGLAIVSWALYGIAYWLFLRSLTPVPISRLPMLSGVNALSFAAGYVTPIPGGLGVREWAMKALLLPVLPSGVAALVAIAARRWNIAAELTGALVMWVAAVTAGERSVPRDSPS